MANWGKISQTCRDAMTDSPDNPCRKEIKDYCSDVEPNVSLRMCLMRKRGKWSAKCREHFLKSKPPSPCSIPTQRFCSSIDPVEALKLNSCLLRHLEDLPPACYLGIRTSPYWPNPCGQDLARLCPRISTTEAGGKEKARVCLTARAAEVTSLCREVILWTPCANTAASLCENQPPRQSRACLLKNTEKLSPDCQKALNIRQAISAPGKASDEDRP